MAVKTNQSKFTDKQTNWPIFPVSQRLKLIIAIRQHQCCGRGGFFHFLFHRVQPRHLLQIFLVLRTFFDEIPLVRAEFLDDCGWTTDAMLKRFGFDGDQPIIREIAPDLQWVRREFFEFFFFWVNEKPKQRRDETLQIIVNLIWYFPQQRILGHVPFKTVFMLRQCCDQLGRDAAGETFCGVIANWRWFFLFSNFSTAEKNSRKKKKTAFWLNSIWLSN